MGNPLIFIFEDISLYSIYVYKSTAVKTKLFWINSKLFRSTRTLLSHKSRTHIMKIGVVLNSSLISSWPVFQKSSSRIFAMRKKQSEIGKNLLCFLWVTPQVWLTLWTLGVCSATSIKLCWFSKDMLVIFTFRVSFCLADIIFGTMHFNACLMNRWKFFGHSCLLSKQYDLIKFYRPCEQIIW